MKGSIKLLIAIIIIFIIMIILNWDSYNEYTKDLIKLIPLFIAIIQTAILIGYGALYDIDTLPESVKYFSKYHVVYLIYKLIVYLIKLADKYLSD